MWRRRKRVLELQAKMADVLVVETLMAITWETMFSVHRKKVSDKISILLIFDQKNFVAKKKNHRQTDRLQRSKKYKIFKFRN